MSTPTTALSRQELPVSSNYTSKWPARCARFGSFQIDFQREELFKDKRRVKVQAKIYQALLVLLSRPGDIVTREEVCRQLWPDAVRANQDANVNTTVNKLRLVLGDSTENPAYIETVPRRGYSFIAPVAFTDELLTEKVAKAEAVKAEVPDEIEKKWPFATVHPNAAWLRIAGFVMVGVLMGALLVLVWSFVSDRANAMKGAHRTNAIAPVSSSSPSNLSQPH